MNINPIRTEQDYKVALQEVSRLVDLDPETDSDEGARLEVLSILLEAYESRHAPCEVGHRKLIAALYKLAGETPDSRGSVRDQRFRTKLRQAAALIAALDRNTTSQNSRRYLWLRKTPPTLWPPRLYADEALDADDFDRLIDEEMKR